MIDVLSVENDKSEKVTIENPMLSNTDDEFPIIDIISPIKSPVKSASLAQDVNKPLKSKYKPKDFHKTSSENKTGPKKYIKGKKMKKEKDYQQGKARKKERKRRANNKLFH